MMLHHKDCIFLDWLGPHRWNEWQFSIFMRVLAQDVQYATDEL